MEFQEGDIIKCINNAGQDTHLTKGKEYVMLEYVEGDIIAIYDDDNCKEGYFAARFILSHKTFVHQLFNFIQDDNT